MKSDVIFTQKDIEKIIPQREPILLIDEIFELDNESIVASFYVSPHRDIFRGHFPSEPLFPGVYTIECMAQASCFLVLMIEKYKGRLPLFIGVDNVTFKSKIKPDSNLIIKSKIIKHNVKKEVVVCASEVLLDGTEVASGVIALAIR